MVILTSAAGFYLGSLRSGISPFNAGMVEALAGIAVVTCGASALNQVLERKTDRLQRRTQDRPMARGRIGLAHGLIVGFLAVFVGSIYLARTTNLLTGTLTLLTAVGYVAIYTPLKQVSSINTFIGAIPGAMPPLIGWTAARGLIEWPGVALFAILFVWQFPHFMAIGWMYREDYARAGIRITSTQRDPRHAARSTVVQALLFAALMVPVSLWPFSQGTDGAAYAVAAAALSLGYLWCTIRFASGQLEADPSVRGRLLAELPDVADTPPTRAPLEFIDTAGASFDEEREPDGDSRLNRQEAELTQRKVQELLDAGLPPTDIAVIAPYAAQVRLLRQLLAVPGLEIDSVDGFQGREKEAVVISLVRSNPKGEIGFLADVRRMNVALTRPRRSLLVIGDSATLAGEPFYQRMIEYFERSGRTEPFGRRPCNGNALRGVPCVLRGVP